MIICLERGADLHMAQLMPLPLTLVKSRLVLPFWYWLTRVVPVKGPLNMRTCQQQGSLSLPVQQQLVTIIVKMVAAC